jgi:hypothetical protein
MDVSMVTARLGRTRARGDAVAYLVGVMRGG